MKETRIHELAKKAGGKFKLTVLLQKRLLELNRAQRQSPDFYRRTPLQIAMDEAEDGKISLLPLRAEDEENQLPSIPDTFEE